MFQPTVFFHVDLSNDNSTFVTVFNVSYNATTAGKPIWGSPTFSSNLITRFVRVVFEYAPGASYCGESCVYELQVHGEVYIPPTPTLPPKPTATPKPTTTPTTTGPNPTTTVGPHPTSSISSATSSTSHTTSSLSSSTSSSSPPSPSSTTTTSPSSPSSTTTSASISIASIVPPSNPFIFAIGALFLGFFLV